MGELSAAAFDIPRNCCSISPDVMGRTSLELPFLEGRQRFSIRARVRARDWQGQGCVLFANALKMNFEYALQKLNVGTSRC
jgi:hypothetical protein